MLRNHTNPELVKMKTVSGIFCCAKKAMASDLLHSLEQASKQRDKMAANGQMFLQEASCHVPPVPSIIPDPEQQAFLTKESSKQYF